MEYKVAVIGHGHREKMTMSEAIHKLLNMDVPPTVIVGGTPDLADIKLDILNEETNEEA